jgi:hypothetical protein
MPRPKGSSNSSTPKTGSSAEGIAPYFRKIFTTHKRYLNRRSNEAVLQMWLDDHPGHAEVPENVKTGLANVKSNMRSKLHKRRGKKAAEEAAAGTGLARTKTSLFLSADIADNPLEELEMLIDKCLTMARQLDKKGRLDNVILALRTARNRVVWKLGEK